MQFPEFSSKVNGPESKRKAGEGRSAFLRSGTAEAGAQIERIRQLKPTERPETKEKISRRLREIGHGPSVRGGNGRPLTEPQRLLLKALGEGWTPELAIALGGRMPGYPTNYKVDLGHEGLMIGIEIDGNCHHSRRALDIKKDAMLASLGWTVLRFWNREILGWINSGMPTESSISTTFRRHGINPSPSTVS
jgi:hypothetical protein